MPSPKSHSAAGEEPDDDEKINKNPPFSPITKSARAASLPVTPRSSREPSRDFLSETESRNANRRRPRRPNREKKLDRAWELRKSSNGFFCGECLVTVRPRGSSARRICMDLAEVKACCDLGLEIPRDFTVEIPGGLPGNSGGGDSPMSGAGEDAREIKAKLKVWAHTVAFVSSAARAGR